MWTYLVALVLVVMSGLYYLACKGRWSKGQNFPPGPPGLPIVGHLPMLGHLPHRALRDISRKYGPIVQLRFGQFPTVLVSTPEAATQILKTHDSVFAGRPYMYAGEFLTYGGRNITASDYGTYWRNARKLCTVHLLSPHKVESFEPMRREEVVLFVKTINESARRGGPINLTEAVDSVISNSTCRMLFGCRLEESASFNKAVKDVIALAGAINIADFIPFFRLFDVQGLVRRMKETSNLMDEFFERKIEERLRGGRVVQQENFIDFFLETLEKNNSTGITLDRDSIKGILMDLFVGGIDTALSTVEWIMSELLKHPKVMKKLREEIRSTIGLDCLVNESDLPKLEYLNMVVKEGFRLHPGAPLLAAHKALEDQEVMGYHIPKNTRIVINAWAIGRTPRRGRTPKSSCRRGSSIRRLISVETTSG
ncbi:hypothetical protein QJS10_CPA01g02058 [Acorus calamus]|uniref:Cytochrome P450 n=1 Tax=Acorus calamus TaxID=4465 RepID=A0AAV9FEX2_ACOCL|nr:hypothetical protein QJS10_CPA01g02058 [Acorus calamus]